MSWGMRARLAGAAPKARSPGRGEPAGDPAVLRISKRGERRGAQLREVGTETATRERDKTGLNQSNCGERPEGEGGGLEMVFVVLLARVGGAEPSVRWSLASGEHSLLQA